MRDRGEVQAREVGEGFVPGPTANAAIATLLGMEAEVRDDQAFVYVADSGDGVPSLAPGWVPCPDYCNDTTAVAELMEFEGRIPYVKPLKKEGKQRKSRCICFFDHGDDVCVTVPFMKGSHALAAALHFVLSESKS